MATHFDSYLNPSSLGRLLGSRFSRDPSRGKVKTSTGSKEVISILFGAAIVAALIAITIIAKVHPNSFGGHAKIVGSFFACGATVGVIAFTGGVISTIALDILEKKKKEKLAPELEIARQKRGPVAEENEAYRNRKIEKLSSPVDTKNDWEFRLKRLEAPSNNRIQGKYFNLASNDLAPISETTLGNSFYRIPYISGKDAQGQEVIDHLLFSVKLPAQNTAALPEMVRECIGEDENVEFFFMVYNETFIDTEMTRNLKLNHMYEGSDFDNSAVLGIFNEDGSIQKNRFGSNSSVTSSSPENAILINEIGKNSTNNKQFTYSVVEGVSSFYLINKADNKTTVSHFIVVLEDDQGDGKILKEACNETNCKEFLDKLGPSHEDMEGGVSLIAKVKSEFSFHPPSPQVPRSPRNLREYGNVTIEEVD